MRQGQQHQQQKRMRGRNNNNNNNNRKGPNPLSRSYESNGPDVKIRGTAAHIADKYVQLARDATSSGDPVAAENYLQHAEHYYRILAAAQPAYSPTQSNGFVRADDESRDEDGDEDGSDGQGQNGGYNNGGQYNPRPPQQHNPSQAPQPFLADGEQPREYQPREQREPREQRDQRDYREPREQREYREARPPREPRPQNVAPDAATGLPAFITGGQDIAPRAEGEGDGEVRVPRPRNRRRFGRAGREDGAPEGATPAGEPEIAPGE